MTWYYPQPLFEMFLGVIQYWIVIKVICFIIPPLGHALNSFTEHKSIWRNKISKFVLEFMHKEPVEKKNGGWTHIDSHVWGTQLFALVVAPSIITYILSLVCYYFFKTLEVEIFYKVVLFLLFLFLTISFVPTKKEIKEVFDTSPQSQWYWLFKAVFYPLFVYIFRFLFTVHYDFFYFFFILCFIIPWDDNPSIPERIFLRRKNKKNLFEIDQVLLSPRAYFEPLTSTSQVLHQKNYLNLLQRIIRATEREQEYQVPQSFVVELEEGLAVISLSVDEHLFIHLTLLQKELSSLWIDSKGYLILNDRIDFSQFSTCINAVELLSWLTGQIVLLRPGEFLRATTKFKEKFYLVSWKKVLKEDEKPLSFEGVEFTHENLSNYNPSKKEETVKEATDIKYQTLEVSKEMSPHEEKKSTDNEEQRKIIIFKKKERLLKLYYHPNPSIATIRSARHHFRKIIEDIFTIINDGQKPLFNGLLVPPLIIQTLDYRDVEIFLASDKNFVNRLSELASFYMSRVDVRGDLISNNSEDFAIELPKKYIGDILLETTSLVITLEAIANAYTRGEQKIVLFGLQNGERGNNGIDLSYMIVDKLNNFDLSFANMIEHEVKSSTTDSSFIEMLMKGFPSNIGKSAVSTFYSSNKKLIDLVIENSLFAYTEDAAQLKKIILEKLHGVITAWDTSAGWIEKSGSRSYKGIIPYIKIKNGKIDAITKNTANNEVIRFNIPETKTVIEFYDQYMQVKIGGTSGIVLHPYKWDSTTKEWKQTASNSESPFYELAIHYSSTANFLLKDAYLIGKNIDEWITDTHTGIMYKYTKETGKYSVRFPFLESIDSVNLSPVDYSFHHYIETNNLYSFDEEVIYHGLVAQIAKRISENIGLFTESNTFTAKSLLASKRSTVHLGNEPSDDLIMENNLLQLYDETLLGVGTNLNLQILATDLFFKRSEQLTEVIPSNANVRYIPTSNDEIDQKIFINDIQYDVQRGIDNLIEESKKDLEEWNDLKYNKYRLHFATKFLDIIPSYQGKKTTISKFRGYFEMVKPNTLTAPRNSRSYLQSIYFCYHWSLRGRNIGSVPFVPVRSISQEVINELGLLKKVVKLKSDVVKHVKKIIESSHKTAILPRYGDTIVGLPIKNLDKIRELVISISDGKYPIFLKNANKEELLWFINLPESYLELTKKYPEYEKMVTTLTHNDLEEIYKTDNFVNIQEFLLSLKLSDIFKVNDKIIYGEDLIRSTDAGKQYLSFQHTISSYLAKKISIDTPEFFIKFLKDSKITHEWLTFYLKSCSNKNIADLVTSYSLQVPKNYSDLLKIFNEFTYGQYQNFILQSQLLEFSHILKSKNLDSLLLWNGIMGKIQEQASLIKAGLVPADPIKYGMLETVATHQLLKRNCDGKLVWGIPDWDKLFPDVISRGVNSGTEQARYYFGVASYGGNNIRKWKGNNAKTEYSYGNEVLVYITRKMRGSDLSHIKEMYELNNQVSNTISEYSWVINKIKDVPVMWYRVKDGMLSGNVSSNRGAYSLFHGTPTLFVSPSEMVRYLANVDCHSIYVKNALKMNINYVWNCIVDIKNNLESVKDVTGRKIMQEVNEKIPKPYRDFSLIVLRSLFF
jgi:hypothetical protein